MLNLHQIATRVTSTIHNVAGAVQHAARAATRPHPAETTPKHAQADAALHHVARQVNLKGTAFESPFHPPRPASTPRYPLGYCPTGVMRSPGLSVRDMPHAEAYHPDPQADAARERLHRFLDPYYNMQREVEEIKHGHSSRAPEQPHTPEEVFEHTPVIPTRWPRVETEF